MKLKSAQESEKKRLIDLNSQIQMLIQQNEQLNKAVECFKVDMNLIAKDMNQHKNPLMNNHNNGQGTNAGFSDTLDERDKRIRELQEKLKIAQYKTINEADQEQLQQDNEVYTKRIKIC